ncbi:MAG TPA: hypothetical protein VFE37_18780 [Chloroflexota bacterium]|nr:hypothetical protein [Chloroflexota bacterium]
MISKTTHRVAPATPAGRAAQRRRGPHAPFSARRAQALRRVLSDVELYSRYVLRRPLRPYQLAPARAILASVFGGQGRTFTVMYARQMGKNELSAILEAYLLALCQRRGGTIVKAAPTFRPQVITSLLRLDSLLQSPLTAGQWRTRHGYIREVGAARALFFSGQEHASVVGATASLLLEIDEAQDFSAAKYTRDFRPMGATANVTTVLYGTAWDGSTLLEQTAAHNQALAAEDGVQRHFAYDWTVGAAAIAAYGAYVAAERDRLGEGHPLFQTQYALRSVAGSGRLLGPAHLAQLAGTHARERRPQPGAVYVAALDCAGEEESSPALPWEGGSDGHFAPHARRDSAVLTLARLTRPRVLGVEEPHLEIVEHYVWTGRKHRELVPQLVDLLKNVWRVRQVVVDATGVGGAVASFLVGALGAGRCTPFVFSASSKSALAYGLLGAINAGRVRMYADDGSPEAAAFWQQARAARYAVRAHQALTFDVDPAEGHDDFLISLALLVEAARLAPERRATARGLNDER